MSKPQSNIAIILVNWNGIADTMDCLYSLQKIEQQNFDCIVVDNASVINPASELLNTFPDIILLRQEQNLGFAGGNNKGIEYALAHNYEYILLLNNDTIVNPGFLNPLVDCLNNNPLLSAVQPLIYFDDQPNTIWSAGGIWNKWLGDSFTIKHVNTKEPFINRDWLTGCAFFVRATTLKQLGGFNNKLFAYYEDVDLSFRINTNHNALALVPTSIIYHKVSASVNASSVANNEKQISNKEGKLNPLVHYWNARNRIWLIKKYQPWFTLPTTILSVFIYYTFVCIYFIVRGRFIKLKAVLKGIWEGCTQTMD